VAFVITPAQHDMRVRMAGIEVIDRHPIELRAEIFFHARHQTAGQRFQVVIFDAILRRHDETELVAVILGTVEKSLAVGLILQRIVKLTRLALAGHAVALDITQMRLCSTHPFAGQFDDAGFDNDPALTKGGITVAAGKHAANARTAPDPAAAEV